jgi:hypothetical protein
VRTHFRKGRIGWVEKQCLGFFCMPLCLSCWGKPVIIQALEKEEP